MSVSTKKAKISLSIEDKFSRAGITNSFEAERAGITMAELYGLGTDPCKDLNFRKSIFTILNY